MSARNEQIDVEGPRLDASTVAELQASAAKHGLVLDGTEYYSYVTSTDFYINGWFLTDSLGECVACPDGLPQSVSALT